MERGRARRRRGKACRIGSEAECQDKGGAGRDRRRQQAAAHVQRKARRTAVLVVPAGWRFVVSREGVVVTGGNWCTMRASRSHMHVRRDDQYLQGQREIREPCRSCAESSPSRHGGKDSMACGKR